jgi:hypothetical protein
MKTDDYQDGLRTTATEIEENYVRCFAQDWSIYVVIC